MRFLIRVGAVVWCDSDYFCSTDGCPCDRIGDRDPAVSAIGSFVFGSGIDGYRFIRERGFQCEFTAIHVHAYFIIFYFRCIGCSESYRWRYRRFKSIEFIACIRPVGYCKVEVDVIIVCFRYGNRIPMVRVHFDMGACAVYLLFERNLIRHCFFRVCFVHPVCSFEDDVPVVSLRAGIGVEGGSCDSGVGICQAGEGAYRHYD